MLDPGFTARLAAELDDAPHLRNLRQQVLVARLRDRLGPAGQENRGRRVVGAEHAPEVLGEEWHDRPDHARRRHERVPQRLQSRGIAIPEAPP